MYTQSSVTLSVIVGLLCGGCAGIWPLDASATAKPQFGDQHIKQVAIIGAGAAGASTAYHLHKFAKGSGVVVNITVFEKSSYVGGRSTTVNAFDDPMEPIELGASIFVKVNRILMGAVDEFSLLLRSYKQTSDEPELTGVWNGDKFVFTQKGEPSWFDLAKFLWRYGLAPMRTQRLMRSTVAKFLQLYESPFFPFRSLSDRALDLDLTPITAVTGHQFLTSNNIGPPFTTDIIQASTRVNYGQNLGIIHGLETMVCMATEGAMQIQGGNWQIFDHMLNVSGATVSLNTTVTTLRKQNGKYTVRISSPQDFTDSGVATDKTFDSVVLAAPLQYSGIELQKDLLKHVPDKIPYVKLHVTLLTSPLKLSRTHFNLKEGVEVPTTILTTLSPDEDPSNRHNIAGKSGFFSISTLKAVTNPKTLRKEYVYKIFSPEKVTKELLSSLFGIQPVSASIFNTTISDAISWYYPHVWHSYPYEYPRVTFEDTELARGLYYTAGIESFISTMETSALMGMNVARLIVDDFLEITSKIDPIVHAPRLEEL